MTKLIGELDQKMSEKCAQEGSLKARRAQDMTATVGRGAGPAYSVFWGHAPRARLCACPDTPCRCTRTRAMPRVFDMPTGESRKHQRRSLYFSAADLTRKTWFTKKKKYTSCLQFVCLIVFIARLHLRKILSRTKSLKCKNLVQISTFTIVFFV